MKILAVDDSATIRDIVKETLYEYDYNDIDTASDGLEALEKVNESEDTYDFFIIDINMPNMNGFELITNLRNKFDYMDTPIMVLTTEKSESMKEKGREAGATSWIVKPFQHSKFIEGLRLTLDYVQRDEQF